jgi:hypothetical protein
MSEERCPSLVRHGKLLDMNILEVIDGDMTAKERGIRGLRLKRPHFP